MTASPAFLHAVIAKHLSAPMNQFLGMTLVSLKAGEVVLRAEPTDAFRNTLDVMHGGYAATLLDSACGMAGNSVAAEGFACVTAELKVAYLRKIESDTGPLTITGRVQKPGRQLVFTEGVIRDAAGRELATATSTLIVVPRGGA